MLSPNRRIVKAMEESTKATLRSAVALDKVTEALREMLREDDEAENHPPPLPKQAQAERTKNPPKK